MDSRFSISPPYEKPQWRVFAVDGYQVPYIKGRLIAEDIYAVLIDDRIEVHVEFHALESVIRVAAYAMAVAAGYPFPGATEKMNPHAIPESLGISFVEDQDGTQTNGEEGVDFSDLTPNDFRDEGS